MTILAPAGGGEGGLLASFDAGALPGADAAVAAAAGTGATGALEKLNMVLNSPVRFGPAHRLLSHHQGVRTLTNTDCRGSSWRCCLHPSGRGRRFLLLLGCDGAVGRRLRREGRVALRLRRW